MKCSSQPQRSPTKVVIIWTWRITTIVSGAPQQRGLVCEVVETLPRRFTQLYSLRGYVWSLNCCCHCVHLLLFLMCLPWLEDRVSSANLIWPWYYEWHRLASECCYRVLHPARPGPRHGQVSIKQATRSIARHGPRP